MWTSSVLVGPNQCGSQTSSMMASRRITSPALAINMWSRSNSLAASSIGSPSLVTVRDEGSKRIGPTSIGPFRAVRSTSAHDGPHARHELARGERLDHVVVGAELEADDPVDLLTARGQHDDRNVGLGPDQAAEVSSVPVGEHHVQQDQVGRRCAPGLGGLLDRSRDLGVEALPSQVLGERLGDRLLVLDDQDTRFHAGIVSPPIPTELVTLVSVGALR